jgi:hypothetical protein
VQPHAFLKEQGMKIKTNVRAGQGQPVVSNDVAGAPSNKPAAGGGKVVYVPPVYVSRCAGL